MTPLLEDDEPFATELLSALRRLARETVVPEPDPLRWTALMTAFDAAQRKPEARRSGYWWMAGLSAAAALLVAVALGPGREGRRGISPPPDARAQASSRLARGASSDPTGSEFIPWPGASNLPPLESGELMRIELPVSLLPSLGVAPPSHVTAVKADVVVGQDGLARAVRLVTD